MTEQRYPVGIMINESIVDTIILSTQGVKKSDPMMLSPNLLKDALHVKRLPKNGLFTYLVSPYFGSTCIMHTVCGHFAYNPDLRDDA